MAEDGSATKLGISIPYLFYDLIARSLPGALFILGLLFTFGSSLQTCGTLRWVRQIDFNEQSGALSVAILGLIVFAFLAISSFVGFLLLSISVFVIEKPFGCFFPLNGTRLRTYLGTGNISRLQREFRNDFGFELTEDSHELARASFLCAYALWIRSPNLARMSGRFDSDLAAAQSTAFVTLALMALSWISFDTRWFVMLAFVFAASLLTFEYLRKKRVFGRYALYLATKSIDSSEAVRTRAVSAAFFE